ncbi:MAG: 50S ribosomal protein L33 [SAR202 cluster bacterium]|nr:50S ribosomal protein L33 [SAR202 cluster bacterium]
MAKKGDARVLIEMTCGDCKTHRYHSTKNKRNDTARLELTKFCPRCRQRRVYRETR